MEPLRGRGPTRRMGRVSEEEGRLSYGGYLRLPELLSLQSPISDPPAHDELLFILLHQAFELWFKEMVFELQSVRDEMLAGDADRARHLLQRIHAIERLLVEQIAVIETMSPQDFLEFRSSLEPASGFQSVQFREIEFLCGLKNPRLAGLADTPEEQERIARRLEEPTVWDGFRALMEASGLPMPEDDEEARRTSLLKVARDREAFRELWGVAEDLLVQDELFALWRARHVLMVERQIGGKRGTGGSSGASYLRATLDRRFYPELWEIRGML